MLATPDECEMIARVSGDELPGDEASDIGFADDSVAHDHEVDLALGHLAGLIVLCDRCRGLRLRNTITSPRTTAERHLQELGHELKFGCCRPAYSESAA